MSVNELLARDEVRPLLEEPELVHIAIETKNGPHVTPELYAWHAGRLWIATARRTLKARTLDVHSPVGVLARHGAHSLVIAGEARPLDALTPSTFLHSPAEMLWSTTAASAFLMRNYRHLLGLVAQAPQAIPHSPSTLRVLVGIRPVAAALLRGHRLVESAGRWHPAPLEEADDDPDVLATVPDASSIIEDYDGDAVIALSTRSGPIALPGAWDPDRSIATVAGHMMALAGSDDTIGAAVAVEGMTGYDFDDKEGAMLRGIGSVVNNGRIAEVQLQPERAHEWQGISTRSTSLEPA